MKPVSLLFVFLFVIVYTSPCLALQPAEILLIVNKNVPDSLKLATYYSAQRNIPAKNLLTVNMNSSEDCSREEYQQHLLQPVRQFIAQNKDIKIRCLVLFYGIPLRVSAPLLSLADEHQLAQLKHAQQQIEPTLAKYKQLAKQIEQLSGASQLAAVDSEISMAIAGTYNLDKWQMNPYFVGFKSPVRYQKNEVLFVSRLDASSPQIVKRMIDDSLYAEENGLRGRAYFDARWTLSEKKHLKGYAYYDASIHKTAELTSNISSLSVSLDQQERLFQVGEAPDAAIYCGWYSFGKYVDAFAWQRGAIGYHIASSEATTLKHKGSQVWCKRMLEEGVAATIGPVAEPYVQGFPIPELFFGFLLDGYYSMAESYFLSLPFISWRMVLIGDPLYRPFRNI